MRALSPAFTAAGTEGAGAAAFSDLAAARTSVSVTRPSGPVPFTLERSTPSSAATRRATGDAFTRASSAFSAFGPGFSAGFFSSFGAVSFFFSLFSAFSSSVSVFGFSGFRSFGFSSFFSGSFFSSSFLGFAFSSSFSFFSSASGFSSFCSSAFSSSSFVASSPSPPMNAILSPTLTFPPSPT